MRMKKMYSLTETTIAIIEELAREQNIPVSYAIDNMAINYWRMTHKKQPIPGITDEKWIDNYYSSFDKKNGL